MGGVHRGCRRRCRRFHHGFVLGGQLASRVASSVFLFMCCRGCRISAPMCSLRLPTVRVGRLVFMLESDLLEISLVQKLYRATNCFLLAFISASAHQRTRAL